MVFWGACWGVGDAGAGMWRSGCGRVVGVETVLLGKSACGVRCVSRFMWGGRGVRESRVGCFGLLSLCGMKRFGWEGRSGRMCCIVSGDGASF